MAPWGVSGIGPHCYRAPSSSPDKEKMRHIATDYRPMAWAYFDSFRDAFFCRTRTRWRPAALMVTLLPSTMSLGEILRP